MSVCRVGLLFFEGCQDLIRGSDRDRQLWRYAHKRGRKTTRIFFFVFCKNFDRSVRAKER